MLMNKGFSKIQSKETELANLEKQLQAKKQLLDQREQYISTRLAEIEVQSAKYRQLEAWEAELKRREQQLRVQTGRSGD